MKYDDDRVSTRRVDLGKWLLANRREAGALLATQLNEYRGRHALILGLPRGGVSVAAEVARHLHADLDVLAVRKLGAPGHEELAIGAVTADGTRYLITDIVETLEVSRAYIEEACDREQLKARRQERALRAGLPALDFDGREVILVDDGIATGATMRAALWSLRRARPKKVVVAVPIGSTQSCASIDGEVDELVCLHSEEPLQSIGLHYRDFSEVSDEQVTALLREHRRPPSPPMAAFLQVQRRR